MPTQTGKPVLAFNMTSTSKLRKKKMKMRTNLLEYTLIAENVDESFVELLPEVHYSLETQPFTMY